MADVVVSEALKSVTGRRATFKIAATSVSAALDEIETRYPGFKMLVCASPTRFRDHVLVYVGDQPVRDFGDKTAPTLSRNAELLFLHATAGG